MVARPVQLRPGARTSTQPLEGTITTSTIAERGRAHIFLGDRFFVYDNMAMSTGVEAIRGAIRESTLDLLELNGIPVSR